MNRVIKFRAWNKYYKEMLSHEDLITQKSASATKETIPLHFVTEYTNSLAAILSSKELKERYELMQFTGLRDKNGVEIYEGDIVEKKNKHKEIGKFVVEFVEGLNWNYNGFGLRKIEGGKLSNFDPESIWFPADEPANWDKVIGNIYENPELLLKTKIKIR